LLEKAPNIRKKRFSGERESFLPGVLNQRQSIDKQGTFTGENNGISGSLFLKQNLLDILLSA
jgi:hypothetical protein